MNAPIRHLSFSLFFMLGFACVLPAFTYGQNPASTDPTAPSTVKPPQTQRGFKIATEDDPLEQIDRYRFFLQYVREMDQEEKPMRDAGYIDLAEAFRTNLQRKAGLSDAEATLVKQVAAVLEVDTDTLNMKGNELNAQRKLNHYRPPAPGSPPPDGVSLSHESVDIVNKAIARLVEGLGSRSFSKLDLYTRHYSDADIAREAAVKKAAADAAAKDKGKP